MDAFRARLSAVPQLHSYLLYPLYKPHLLNPPVSLSPPKLFSQVTSFLALGFVTATAQSKGGLLCRGHLSAFQPNYLLWL